MIQINLSEQQQQTLMVFLNRVQLQGSEVPAFINLVNVLKATQRPILKKEIKDIKKEAKPNEEQNKRDKSRPTSTESA